MGAQARPLPVEHPLDEDVRGDLGLVLAGRRRERGRVAPRERRRPGGPGPLPVVRLEREEERHVLQPAPLARLEGGEIRRRRRRGAGGEALGGAAEERGLEPRDHPVVHGVVREAGRGREVVGGEPALVAQILRRDEEGVAGERRERLVGRVAVAGGRERQHLPDRLAGLGQPPGEGAGGGAQVAHAEGAGQGGGVEHHPGPAAPRGLTCGGWHPPSPRARPPPTGASAARAPGSPPCASRARRPAPGRARSRRRPRRRRR